MKDKIFEQAKVEFEEGMWSTFSTNEKLGELKEKLDEIIKILKDNNKEKDDR